MALHQLSRFRRGGYTWNRNKDVFEDLVSMNLAS